MVTFQKKSAWFFSVILLVLFLNLTQSESIKIFSKENNVILNPLRPSLWMNLKTNSIKNSVETSTIQKRLSTIRFSRKLKRLDLCALVSNDKGYLIGDDKMNNRNTERSEKKRTRFIFKKNHRQEMEVIGDKKKSATSYLTFLKGIRGGHDNGGENSGGLSTIDLLICGGIATAAGDLALHPIDTIKTIQQASHISMSMFGACKKIVQDLGPFGFYAGVAPYVTMDGLAGSIKFATYEAAKKLVNPLLPRFMIPYSHFLCAATAFMSCSVVLVPGELLKQRLQAGVAKTLAGGMKQIWITEGWKGFFTGYKATLIRDVPYTMLELGLYENFKSLIRWHNNKETLSQGDELMAAAVTGGIVGFLTNPLDLVKTRLMTGSPTEYKGVFDVISQMYKKEGLSVFMNGAQARVLWLLPFTVIHLGVYEASKRAIVKMKSLE